MSLRQRKAAMSAIREIRDRIASIQNTMKITNAMYMISSTKMNAAKSALNATEPYFFALEAMFARVMRHLPPDFEHAFLDRREKVPDADVKRAIVCVTADKGLAGAYNHNVLRMMEEMLRPDGKDLLFVIGEVGHAYCEQRGIPVYKDIHETAQKPTLPKARVIASRMLDLFAREEVDEVYIIYTRMKNSMENEVQRTQLLPLVRLNSGVFRESANAIQEEFDLQPDPETLLDNIIPDFVSGYIYGALVESYCAEHSSRMQAMDAANKAGEKLLSELSVKYNRERQAAITQEITEVAAGARARSEQLKKSRRKKMAAGKES